MPILCFSTSNSASAKLGSEVIRVINLDIQWRRQLQSYSGSLLAGAATRDITPSFPVFLYGYPFVSRYSTGVHDPLLSSALYLSDGKTEAMFVANDIIWIGKASVRRIRERIASLSAVPARNILISGTHTHSGPMTLDYISNADDPVVPKTDLRYVHDLEEAVVAVAREAISNAGPAEVGLAVADGSGIGTNRHDPQGPADREVPVLMVRSALDSEVIACMLVCSMHPTVLHEDSTLISGDFPAMARQYLQQEVLRRHCPVLHHTGPSGNLSPRHTATSNTFAEAQRLGQVLGRSIAAAIDPIEYSRSLPVQCTQTWVDLPRRSFPSVADAEANRKRAMKFLEDLRLNNASRQEIRTAEVDWFGAEESVTLARAAAEGRLEAALECCLPAEIQIIRIGPWSFVGWQGEIFVEYALAVKARARNTFVISLANGELQGYICTSEAFEQGFY
jgi:hypothetical protein